MQAWSTRRTSRESSGYRRDCGNNCLRTGDDDMLWTSIRIPEGLGTLASGLCSVAKCDQMPSNAACSSTVDDACSNSALNMSYAQAVCAPLLQQNVTYDACIYDVCTTGDPNIIDDFNVGESLILQTLGGLPPAPPIAPEIFPRPPPSPEPRPPPVPPSPPTPPSFPNSCPAHANDPLVSCHLKGSPHVTNFADDRQFTFAGNGLYSIAKVSEATATCAYDMEVQAFLTPLLEEDGTAVICPRLTPDWRGVPPRPPDSCARILTCKPGGTRSPAEAEHRGPQRSQDQGDLLRQHRGRHHQRR